jgi:hypothetical protein
MSLATDILNLRRNQSSSVSTLIAMLEWQRAAQDKDHVMSRGFAVAEAADDVLMNVAVYAAEAWGERPAMAHRARRTAPSSGRKRQFDSGRLHQRRLFAPTAS